MIRIKNIVKFIFILLAILLIAIWFQFFHSDFFDENSEENVIVSEDNKIVNNYITTEHRIQSNNRDMAISIGEEMYIKICSFNFELGDFNVEQGATEVLNIEKLKEITTEKAFDDYINNCGIEKDDNNKYWDTGDRGNNHKYLNHHELEVKKVEDEKINYIVTEYYAKNVDDVEKSFSNLNTDQMEIKRNKFTIVRANNEWKVSEFSNPK